MSGTNAPKLSFHMIQKIREAILLGGASEIGDILALVENDTDFPKTLRHGLEAMLYFRFYYGKGGKLEPADSEDKKNVTKMEILWGRELIESLEFYSESIEAKIA